MLTEWLFCCLICYFTCLLEDISVKCSMSGLEHDRGVIMLAEWKEM